MYTEINRQLEEAQQDIYCLHKIDSMLKDLRDEQLSLEPKVSELKDILDKEDFDVKKLEGNSLAGIFYSILGRLEEHVEKEQREALAAKLKYDQAVRDLEDVKYEAERAQTLLRRFRTELADVKISDDICFETGGFAKFADFFFDGLIADWFMQSKIKNSHDSVSKVRSQVQGVLNKLSSLENQESARIKKAETEIKELITKA